MLKLWKGENLLQKLNDEIIHCRNCEYYDKNNRFCNKWFGSSEPQDFCMKGAIEEIESDNNNGRYKEPAEQTFSEEPAF